MIKVLSDLVSGKGPFPYSQMSFIPLCLQMAEGAKKSSGVPCIKTLIPFMRLWPPCTNDLQKVLPPNAMTSVIRLQHMNLGGHKHLVHNTHTEK